MQVAMCSTRSCQVRDLISKKIVNIVKMHSQLKETMSKIRLSSMINNQVKDSKKSVPVKDCNLGNACAIAIQALSSFCNDTGIENGLDDGDALGNGTGAADGLDDGDALGNGTGAADGLDDGDALGNGTGAADGLDDVCPLGGGIVGDAVGWVLGETVE
jgi:hypothetical protein